MNVAQNKTTTYQPVKLPLFSTIFGAYGLIIDKFKQFVITGTIFAVIFMILSIASGQAAMCYNEIYRATHFCTQNWGLFIGLRLLVFMMICMFLRIWYQFALAQKTLNFKQMFIPKLADLKIAGGFLAYLVTIAVSCLSFYLLLTRVPNPDWRIEILYFSVVSLGFFVPILALRFLVYFAFFAAEEVTPPLRVVWHKAAGNSFTLLGGIVLLLLSSFFITQALVGSIITSKGEISVITMLGSEYLSDIAPLFTAACFMNYCSIQKIFLFERNDDGQSNNS